MRGYKSKTRKHARKSKGKDSLARSKGERSSTPAAVYIIKGISGERDDRGSSKSHTDANPGAWSVDDRRKCRDQRTVLLVLDIGGEAEMNHPVEHEVRRLQGGERGLGLRRGGGRSFKGLFNGGAETRCDGAHGGFGVRRRRVRSGGLFCGFFLELACLARALPARFEVQRADFRYMSGSVVTSIFIVLVGLAGTLSRRRRHGSN